jgi:hypothetical protein
MKIKFYIVLVLLSTSFSTLAQNQWPESLILTPEKSNFVKTSTHAEVMQFIADITALAPNSHVISMGKSPEGRDIPVVVLATSKITSPAEAVLSGKPVIYIQGNIHAGEVEGKEAVMMLMRDILLGKKKHLLENQIILFAPIYNTDSNDKMQKGRRPSQEDSPLEVGIRENSQGLDLNRDGVKMETPETQGLMTNIITKWDPQMFVDLHTTNGTWHAYSLTWAPSYHSAGELGPYDFVNTKMLKDITKTIHQKYGLYFGPYGDYDVNEGWPLKNFATYNHHPRYIVNQFGLRNRMAILSEAFSHERFYQRIYSTYTFVTEILEYTNSHAVEIVSINKKAEEDAIRNVKENAGKVKKGVRFKMVSTEKLNNFRTYDYVSTKKQDGKIEYKRSGNVITVDSVNYFGAFKPEVESTLPRGYVIPAEFSAIVEHLKKHGVKVEQMTKAGSYKGESFQITELKKSQRKFEGHLMASVAGEFKSETKKFKKGDYIIDLAQPLANFIFYLLEPQSDDGLVNWNFFDAYIEKQKAGNKSVVYPVFKYY